jgi:hypothetical protein
LTVGMVNHWVMPGPAASVTFNDARTVVAPVLQQQQQQQQHEGERAQRTSAVMSVNCHMRIIKNKNKSSGRPSGLRPLT